MTGKINVSALLAASVLVIGCASQQSAKQSDTPATTAAKTQSSEPGTRTVKSMDGTFDGEIVGTPAPNSKFAKLKIGMTMHDVNGLIGVADDLDRHETGKRWIPFYFGDDAQRMEALYKGEGCLTYTAGNAFGGGGGELIRITVDATGACMEQ